MKGIHKNKEPQTIPEWLTQHGDRNLIDLRKSKKGLYVVMSDFSSGKEKQIKVYLPENLQHE